MRFDSYTLKARIAPALFSIIIPIMVFNHFYVCDEFSHFVGEIAGAKLVSNLSISGIFLLFMSEFGRVIGKNVFEKTYFKDERYMPSVNFMMFNDSTYSEPHKNRIRNKLADEFGVQLPTKEEESADQDGARARIVEVMAFVRKKLHGNKFLLQHNIEYGAMRNAIGGAVFGVILSVINVLFFSCLEPRSLAVKISVVTLVLYLFLLALSKYIIEFYGNSYAKILFREYLG
ncbi:MAG: hypothetical protein D6B27_06785 [Gammaproteobacteria bacterium]|nr:MAG: hypothetical protein D6B27_06785 [Gammaproteobacteria bacterium]